MMRTIDATLLESKINEFVADDVNDIKHQQHREGAKYAVKRIRKIIQDVHTLDVQPIVYASIKQSDDMFMIHGEMVRSLAKKCTNCGRTLCNEAIQHGCKYCYHCGAKMDKEIEK